MQGVVTYKAILGIDNADLLLRPGMTATAEIIVTGERRAADAQRGAALRARAADEPQQRSFLSRLLPRPPQFRAAATARAGGPNRTVWVLRNGEPAPVMVEVGSTDGRRTESQGRRRCKRADKVIVDQTTSQ